MVDKTSELYGDQSCKEIKSKGHVIIMSKLKKKSFNTYINHAFTPLTVDKRFTSSMASLSRIFMCLN